MPRSLSTLRFSGSRLTELREEAGLSQKALALRLGAPWQLLSLWEASPAPDLPRVYPVLEPSASQLQDLARALDAHPTDFFQSYEDAAASEKDELRAAAKATGIQIDGARLAQMRKLRGLSVPQAAARARVPAADIQGAELGRTINAGALFRLLQVYRPSDDPRTGIASVLVSPGRRRWKGHGCSN